MVQFELLYRYLLARPQDSRSQGRDLNVRRPDNEAGLLLNSTSAFELYQFCLYLRTYLISSTGQHTSDFEIFSWV
jgi:hypothetical protein